MFEDFDEQAAMKRIEKKLESYKQWKDNYNMEWIEIDGKKMLKRALVRVCMDHERAAAMNKFDFLSY